MNSKPFIHLHFHTAYSLLDGACAIDKTMKRAHELKMPSVAMTDHGVLYGAVEFYKKAKSEGIKPILGCEVYVAKDSMHERTKAGFNHLVLLAENEEGYENLMYLVSKGHLEGFYYKPRIDKELLSQKRNGLIALAACLKGEVAELCVQGRPDQAEKVANEYVDIMGKDHFFLEIQDHGLDEQRLANREIIDIARRTGIPMVATNDVHYIESQHSRAHEVMLCLQTQTVMSDPNRMRYGSDQFYMKSAEEMWALFGDYPDALTNTMEVADRCNVELHLGDELHFPIYDVPKEVTQKQHLIALGHQGLRELYDLKDPEHPANEEEESICKRFDYEMGIIEKTGFINYFLVVADFIRFARKNKIPVGPGRGSGAGSLVAYTLGITGINPLQYNLIFERFLNPERVSPPDFDIDFCQSRRGEVIEYVKDKYGRENVAQIITFGTLGAKTVIRDIGRVLEISYDYCDKLAKMIPEDPSMTLEKALEISPEFKKTTEQEPEARRIMEYARVLQGLPRNPGTHAAGVVIGERPLIELLPLARDKNQEPVTQFEMKPMEATGLLKMDFLGLKTLTVIQECLDNIKETCGVDLDIDTISLEDKTTYDLLNRGDTVGVFQLESGGMRNLLRRIGLDRIEDLIAMIALYRPGPMNMLDDYVNRKHGKVEIRYDHPLLEPILKETYGVMLYQEQVQHAARALAGFSLGQGDILRRAMGKKKPEEMAAQRDKFVKGCFETNKIPKAQAEKIFDNIEHFAGYGFNKSHSAAYGIIAYQTAYLKAHYPVEFMAALLSIEMANSDKLIVFISEAQEMDIDVLPPDVNLSSVRFRPIEKTIRFGMAGVKNVGTAAVESIVTEREANGPYKDLVDFCSRIDGSMVNRKVIESLVKCGAFDFTGMSRGRVFNGVDFAMSRAASAQRDRQQGQTTLFGMMAGGDDAKSGDNELPEAPPWSNREMLAHEKALLGFYISGHPLKEHEWALKHFSLARPEGVAELGTGAETRTGGLISQYRKTITKATKRPMGIFRLEGLEGSIMVIVFPDTFEEYGALLEEEKPVMVCGEVDVRDQEAQIKASEIYPLEDAHKLFCKHVSIHVSAIHTAEEDLEKIRDVIRRHPGSVQAVICLQFPSGEKVFVDTGNSFEVNPSAALEHELDHILGEGSVFVEKDPKACRMDHSKGRRNNWRKAG